MDSASTLLNSVSQLSCLVEVQAAGGRRASAAASESASASLTARSRERKKNYRSTTSFAVLASSIV